MWRGIVAVRSDLAGAGASLRLGHRHGAGGTRGEGASDAALQGILGGAAGRPGRPVLRGVSRTLDCRLAQEAWRVGGVKALPTTSPREREGPTPQTPERRAVGKECVRTC